MMNVLLLSIGATLGAVLRWRLGVWLNALLPHFALGTWLANMLGCGLMGVALALSLRDGQKLMLVTGFLGSFTTLSAFSGEVVQHLLDGYWGQAGVLMACHVLGGIAMTLLGVYLTRYFI